MTDQVIGVFASLALEEDIGKAGPVGLFLILSLLVVVFFLGRSMRTHLRRVPLEFPDHRPAATGLKSSASGGDVLEGEILDSPDDGQSPGNGRGNPPRPEPPGPNRV